MDDLFYDFHKDADAVKKEVMKQVKKDIEAEVKTMMDKLQVHQCLCLVLNTFFPTHIHFSHAWLTY